MVNMDTYVCNYLNKSWVGLLNTNLIISIYKYRNFEFVIFKQPEKQMYGEGPILLSTMEVKGQNIRQQIRNDLIKSATYHGFK